jgi:hypothetical protein
MTNIRWLVSRWLLKDMKYDILEKHQEVSQILIEGLKGSGHNHLA